MSKPKPSLFTDQRDWMNPVPESGWFNSYGILDVSTLHWKSAIYEVTSQAKVVDGAMAVEVAWEAKRSGSGNTKGYGYIVEHQANKVVVPANWRFDEQEFFAGCRLRRVEERHVRADRSEDALLAARILKEALKISFKDRAGAFFGPLWRDFSAFCQMPSQHASCSGEFSFCRRFDFDVKPLAGGRFAVRFVVGTATIDHRSLADYYNKGEVDWLAEMVAAKRHNRLTRRSRQVGIRVWKDTSKGINRSAEVLTLKTPEAFTQDARLTPLEQRARAADLVECQNFGKPAPSAAKDKLHLVLDAQITGQDHRETILEPAVRMNFAKRMRDVVSNFDAFGRKVCLASEYLSVDEFEHLEILPPAIYIRGSYGAEILPAPSVFTASELDRRAKTRRDMIRRYGFFEGRVFNPVLAYPQQRVSAASAEAIKDLLNCIWEEQGVDFHFERLVPYLRPEDMRRIVEDGGYNGMLAILPELSGKPADKNDTHEKIKRSMTVPSQCVHLNNALPKHFQELSLKAMARMDPSRLARVRRTLSSCLDNLLVKANCVPFAPAEPYHYNVHLGIDVGGRANNRIMACLGHGFARPQDGIVYRPFEIPLDSTQAEPIHPDALYEGLLNALADFHAELLEMGITPDFNSLLVLRDGELLGAGDEWDEVDALRRLHEEAHLRHGWVGDHALWTAVGIMKHSEGWRVVEPGREPVNPTVGRCYFPFRDPNLALVSTTGRPYLTQGTASPLKIRILDIAGRANRADVLRDVVWEADMCFTKPDMGEKLPWVLQVADAGALQSARSYQLTDITA